MPVLSPRYGPAPSGAGRERGRATQNNPQAFWLPSLRQFPQAQTDANVSTNIVQSYSERRPLQASIAL